MAIRTSGANGDWTATASWNGGNRPTNGDSAVIGHTITYNETASTNTYSGITLNNSGILTWKTDGSTILKLKGDIVNGGSSGKLRIGTAAAPIGAAYTAEIQCCTSSADIFFYGSTGEVVVCGSDKTPVTYLTANAASGSNTISVNDLTGWTTSDQLEIENSYTYTGSNSTSSINGIAGSVITLSGNLTRAHLSGSLVGNFTRNVFFTKSAAATPFNGIFSNADTCPMWFKNIEFRDCLSASTSKRLIDFTAVHTGNYAGNVSVNGCSGSAFWFAPNEGDGGAVVENLVARQCARVLDAYDGKGQGLFKGGWITRNLSSGNQLISVYNNGVGPQINDMVFSNCIGKVFYGTYNPVVELHNCKIYACSDSSAPVYLDNGFLTARGCYFSTSGVGAQANNTYSIYGGNGAQIKLISCFIETSGINANQTRDWKTGINIQDRNQVQGSNMIIQSRRTAIISTDTGTYNGTSGASLQIDSENNTTPSRLVLEAFVPATASSISIYGKKSSTSGWTSHPVVEVYNKNWLLQSSGTWSNNDTNWTQKTLGITASSSMRNFYIVVQTKNNSASVVFNVDSVSIA